MKRYLPVLRACSLQALAAGLGLIWGWSWRLLPVLGQNFGLPLAGLISAALLALAIIRVGSRPESRPAALVTVLTPFYILCIMILDPLLLVDYDGDRAGRHAAVVLCLLVPPLLAIGRFARIRNWAAALGAALFFTASIAMLVRNAASPSNQVGFFHTCRKAP